MGETTKSGDEELPQPYAQVQTAIWLIGLAIVAWRGWWWPGILVLVAISGLTQALMAAWLKRRQDEAAAAAAARALQANRTRALPANCPACGGSLEADKVTWRSDTVAVCPWCTAPVNAVE